MKYGIFSQNMWLFPDSQTEEGSLSTTLTLLKGQTGGIQVLVSGLTEGADISFSSTLSGMDIRSYREMEVCVNRNTNDLHNGPLTTDNWEDVKRDRVRRAPYRTYDPLMPLLNLSVEKEQEVYYISFCPDTDSASGVQNGVITLSFGAESIKIPVTIDVCEKSLPENTLKLTNWFSVDQMASAHGLEVGSPEHEAMIHKYFDLLRYCNNNVFWVTFEDMKVTNEDGNYIFDFTGLKKRAELILSHGDVILEWSPIINRPTWEDPPFQIRDWANDGYVMNALATDGRKYLTAFLRQFNDFLTENNWRDISLVHISDEPKESVASDFRILAGIFRKYLPGIKLIDAVEIYFIQDALDIYVPKNHYFQFNRNDFEALRDDRNELWFYTCNMPGGRFLTRYIDSPLLNTRLLHWGNYRYNLTGYLHWGFNHVQYGQDPFEETSANAGLPAGDTHIVYPVKESPLPSLRFMQMKCGVEDYDILHAISISDKEAADKLCRKAIYAFDDYIKDVAEFDRIQTEVVKKYNEL